MRTGRKAIVQAVQLWLLLTAAACDSHSTELAGDPIAPGALVEVDATVDARTPEGDIADAASVARPPDAASMRAARCGSGPCACDDGLDNDADGLVDGLDPECTGALDQDEATFATGRPSKAKNCRDCFWDEDQGTGNDACRYPNACLRGTEPSGNGNCSSCQVSSQCVDTCEVRTPSGCDCFGCCDVWLPNGHKLTVELSDRCSVANLEDPAACPLCTQSSQCSNACGRCELCLGRSVRDLPADCAMSTKLRCEEGQTPCATSTDCAAGDYCQQGCCYAILL